MGRILAPKYTLYLAKARAKYKGVNSILPPEIEDAALNFNVKGFTSYRSDQTHALAVSMLSKVIAEETEFGEDSVWGKDSRYIRGDIFQKFPEVAQLLQGQIGTLTEHIFGSYFKVFYGVMYKSVGLNQTPTGSQLWHSDGGPGTCMNLMFCLSQTHGRNGAMEFIPWKISLKIFSRERSACRSLEKKNQTLEVIDRNFRNDYYEGIIKEKFLTYKEQLVGDEGLVIAFRNNLIHKGGYCDAGYLRYVCVFHLYPALQNTPWMQYEKFGISKKSGYPDNPDF